MGVQCWRNGQWPAIAICLGWIFLAGCTTSVPANDSGVNETDGQQVGADAVAGDDLISALDGDAPTLPDVAGDLSPSPDLVSDQLDATNNDGGLADDAADSLDGSPGTPDGQDDGGDGQNDSECGADGCAPTPDPCLTTRLDEQTATLIFSGSGSIPTPKDGVSGTLGISSPPNCRGGKIDVVILPEGYKAQDMQRFEQDAQLWLADFKALEPYKSLLQAFNVWIVLTPSSATITKESAGDSKTYYDLGTTDAGTGLQLPSNRLELRTAVFNALDYLPYNRTHKYLAGSQKNVNLLKQVVAVILVFDPKKCFDGTLQPNAAYANQNSPCDGLSGYTVTLEDPNDATVKIRAAMGTNRLHELGHAFALLTDEYRTDGPDPKVCTAASYLNDYNASNWDISSINNYAYSNDAQHLPWKHLLYGAGITKTQGVIGAFEGAFTCWEGAYRPEYKCLMNGSHGNADACKASGLSLRKTTFCNWCHELVTMRIFEKVGALDGTDPLKDWADNYRPHFWKIVSVATPTYNDTCNDPVTFEWTPTGYPCETDNGGHSSALCLDKTLAPTCGWTDTGGFSYCTRTCTTVADCSDLFENPCCAQGAVEKLCRPASDPRCP